MGTLRHSQLRRDAKILLIGAMRRYSVRVGRSTALGAVRSRVPAYFFKLFDQPAPEDSGAKLGPVSLRRRLLAAGVLPSVAGTGLRKLRPSSRWPFSDCG